MREESKLLVPKACSSLMRITKKVGVPIQLVPEATPGATVVGIKRVNELDFYSIGRNQIPECFKPIAIGKSTFARYSQKAVGKIQEALKSVSADEIWRGYREQLELAA